MVLKNFEKILRTLWEENKQVLLFFCKIDNIWVKKLLKTNIRQFLVINISLTIAK